MDEEQEYQPVASSGILRIQHSLLPAQPLNLQIRFPKESSAKPESWMVTH
jgi:hypothetical protein